MLWILIAVAAGVIQGSFTLPMKYTGRWKWENTWGMWSVWALLILPWVIAFCHGAASGGRLPIGVAGGARRARSWSVFAGESAPSPSGWAFITSALRCGFAIIMGLSVAVGSLIPLFMQPEKVFSPAGLTDHRRCRGDDGRHCRRRQGGPAQRQGPGPCGPGPGTLRRTSRCSRA